MVNGNGIIVPLAKELMDEEIANFLNFTEAEAIVYTTDIFEEKLSKAIQKAYGNADKLGRVLSGRIVLSRID